MKNNHSDLRDVAMSNTFNSPEDKLEDKTKEQLQSELAEALRKISELMALENRRKEAETQVREKNEFFQHVLVR